MLRYIFLCSFVFTMCGNTILKDDDGNTYYTGLIKGPEEYRAYGEPFVTLDDCDNLPADFDLRNLGVVPPIKDQGQCGSCWAFSKTASLESAIGGRLDLSEQQLVSCDRNNYGCNGGNLNTNEYQISKGQALETDFPYEARGVKCKADLPNAAKGSDFVYIGDPNRSPTQKELQCALFKSKTIPWITVAADAGWTYVPKDPDFVMKDCGSGYTNHAVGVVGWRTLNGKVSFIMRNSWGPKWGNEGYLNMPLGCDRLAEEAAYIVGALDCKPPKADLPAEVISQSDKEGTLEVAQEEGVDYHWYHGTRLVSTTNKYTFKASKAGTIRLVAKNKCGKTTVRTKLRISH